VRALLVSAVLLVACSSSEDPGAAVPGADAIADSSSGETSSDTGTTVDSASDTATSDASDSTTSDSSSDVASETSSDASVKVEAGAACSTSADCDVDSFCDYPVGTCGVKTMGTCVRRPGKGDCVKEPLSPVCGCDGKDYDSACLAALTGNSVAKTGPCGGTSCGNGTCEPKLKEDCSTCPADCGSCACGDGVCTKGTEDCTSCPADCCSTSTCKLGTLCAPGLWCEFPVGSCGTSPGSCVAQPAAGTCPTPGATDTVCTCDGDTYSSACEAAVAGVSVKSSGLCK
jgi:hypothetical protein